MIVELLFKTPDVTMYLNEEELEAAKDLLNEYLKYDEMIRVQFDTETKEVKVCKAR
jgi:hypothetical protein